MARLFDLTGDDRYRQRAQKLIEAFAGEVEQNPIIHATLLTGLTMLERPLQIVIVGYNDDPDFEALRHAALAAAVPGATVQIVSPDAALPSGHPAYGKGLVEGKPAAYICEAQTCRLPVTSADQLRENLEI